MKYKIIISIILALIFSPSAWSAEMTAKPTYLKFAVGGLFTPANYTVKLNEGAITFTLKIQQKLQTDIINPTENDFKQFRQTLDEIGIWDWQGPTNENMHDGAGMDFEIKYPDKSIALSRNLGPENYEGHNQLISAIEKLTSKSLDLRKKTVD